MIIRYHLIITISLTLLACMGGGAFLEATQEARAQNEEKLYLPYVTADSSVVAPPTATPTSTSQPIPTHTATPTSTSQPIPTHTATPMPPPTATPLPTATPSPTGRKPWLEVSSWAYQLSTYPNGNLDQIRNSNFDLVVIDLARDGYLDYFTNSEIQAVQATNKYALAYFEVGAIENYRPEWNQVPDDLKLGPVSGWENEQYVKYWDERWWPIVQGRLDQALTAGFDGAYLDMIVTYEEIPANSAGTDRTDLARKMTALIERISVYAKSINPDFKIVPQNSPELGVAGYLSQNYSQADANRYLAAVDGLGMEEMFYLATDTPCSYDWCQGNQNNAQTVGAQGNLILAIDYANQQGNIADAYSQARTVGFVPYASVRSLNILRINAGLDP